MQPYLNTTEQVNDLLQALVKELLVIRHGQPCIRTANNVPMGMGSAKERRVKNLLKALSLFGWEHIDVYWEAEEK